MDTAPLNGSEIAKELGITRQSVSQTLKKGLNKLYYKILDEGIADTPFDAVLAMMITFKLHTTTQDDLIDFLYLLPNGIRREVEKDARERRQELL